MQAGLELAKRAVELNPMHPPRFARSPYVMLSGHETLRYARASDQFSRTEDNWFVARYENDPARPERWETEWWRLICLRVVYSTELSVTDDMKALFVPGSAVLERPYTVDQLLTSLSVRLLPVLPSSEC
jgi:hypothetical protein